MRIVILFIFAICLLGGCSRNNSEQDPLLNLVPEDTGILIKINNLSTFKSELKNTKFISDARNTELASKLNVLKQLFDTVDSDTTCLLALMERDSMNFLLLTPEIPGRVVPADSSLAKDTIRRNLPSIDSIAPELHMRIEKGIRLISNSEQLLNEAVTENIKKQSDPLLRDLYKASLKRKSATLFINTNTSSDVFPSFLEKDSLQNKRSLEDWIMFDINSNQNYLYLNGLVKTRDTIGNFLRLFEGTKPVQNVTAELAGPNSDAIVSYTFDDYEIFVKNQQAYSDSPYSMEIPLNGVEEVGVIYQNGQKAIVLNVYATESVQKYLDQQTTATRDYQGHEITTIKDDDFLTKTFYPLVVDFKSKYYTVLSATS